MVVGILQGVQRRRERFSDRHEAAVTMPGDLNTPSSKPRVLQWMKQRGKYGDTGRGEEAL